MVLTALLVLLALPLAGSALAQESEPSPAASEPAQARDIVDALPRQMGGFEPEYVVTRGREHIANLQPDDPVDARTSAELQALLDETGVTIEDMTSAYALVSQSDFFSFVVAVRLDGAQPGSVLPAYLPILMGDLIEPSAEEGVFGGKPVTIILSEGTDREIVPLYVYANGDTVWILQGPDDVVAFALEDLP